MRPDVAYVYVRDLLERLTGERPTPDRDGDLPVHFGGAQFYVRVVGALDPWVQVFSIAAAELHPTPELMVHLNEINRELRFARAFHVADQVLIESEIWADDVNPANFLHACRNVAGATDAYSPGIRKTFGGRPHFDESKTEEYQQGTLPLDTTSRSVDPDTPPASSAAMGPYL
jgi:hypothetical protein